MSDQSESSLKNIGIFSTLQGATDIKFFLLCTTFALLADNVFLSLGRPGLIELAMSKEALATSNLAFQIVLIFIAFSFLTSLGLPMAAVIVDELYIHTAGSWISHLSHFLDKKTGNESAPRSRQWQCVSLWELRHEAHHTQDKYYLDLYKEQENVWHKRRQDQTRFALYSFYGFAMLATNFYFGHSGKPSAAAAMSAYAGNSYLIWFGLSALAFMTFWRYYDREELYWIYCPTLYQKVTSKEKADFPRSF